MALHRSPRAPTYAELYDLAFGWNIEPEVQAIHGLWNEILGGEPKTICDVGAGTGRFLIPMLRRKISCIAVEPDSSMSAVLLRKLDETCEAIDRPKILSANFEDTDGIANMDCILAMTDVISYVFPPAKLRRFIRQCRDSLRIGGIMIADVALWSGYPGESRAERWASSVLDGAAVYAECVATVQPIYRRVPLVRIERLTFEHIIPEQRTVLSKESLLHAFNFRDLENMFSAAGLDLMAAFTPTAQKLKIVDRIPRAILGFRKTRTQ